MKMGRRRGGGRRSSSVLSQNDVLRHLDSLKNKNPTVDEAVDHLRSNYPSLSRLPVQPLTTLITKTLERRRRKTARPSSNHGLHSDEDYDGDVQARARKKRKKSLNAREEPSSPSEEEDEEEDDGTVSTTEDAMVYSEKEEMEFDLMKSMLRDNYSSGGGKKLKLTNLEEELEIGGNAKPNKLINTSVSMIQGGGGGGGGGEGKSGEKGKGSSSIGLGNKGKEKGPRFRDFGGMDDVLKELKMKVIVPLYHPQLLPWLGARPITGILLHGPPGCGKTTLAQAIANETGVPFYQISATDVVSGVSGASEENIRELFSKAYRTAPSIVFIDEIDAIASKRENLQRQMEGRIVTQLMTCMDESHRRVLPSDVDSNSESSDCRPGYVLVIGATNRPDAIDPALRRPGRFDREFVLGVPDENARAKILSVLTRNVRLEGSFDLKKLARSTPGFVGTDLAALATEAAYLAIGRAMGRVIDRRQSELVSESVLEEQTEELWRNPLLPEEMEKFSITMADFEEATKLVQPSLRREGFSTIPNVKWEDVGGLDSLRQEFDRYIIKRIKYPEIYEEFGLDLDIGFLLYGPPGCGKTLIAKAVANEAGANFIHIKGPELLNKYVGESELAVRTIFSRARTCSPCILFFDEVDALTTERGREGGWVVERVLNQLLIELDGADQRRGVFVIGATNRPEVMDRAVLRPGRFGKLLYVPLPKPEERGLILKALARKKPIDDNVDLIAIGRKEACENLSGVDLAAVMDEAAMVAIIDKLTSTQNSSGTTPTPSTIKATHVEQALQKIWPSVLDEQKQYYETLSARFKAA